jgi:Domain of unknown function (DUF4440)
MRWAIRRPVQVTAGALVVAVLLLVVTGHSVGPRSGASDQSTVTNLQEMERMRIRALVDADMRVVDRLHAADFELIPPPGTRLTRAEFLDAVAAGDLDFLAVQPISTIEVRLHGKRAVVWYRSRIDIVSAGEGRFTHEAWHTCVYEIREGRWQIVREQATAVGGIPPGKQS